ncbi:hypothetical protein BJ508DRAFT_59542 [Ascobolus immersus RN42]|uniref:Uncharacterized protein n=1 Tax=Ascobolus immersus RN42 TaxID=1160509 RepID=A0A3N4IMR4_ASCIM|nr:hypothetical protein BJ508DRAFT_59542 [Ascobolus immersus RN42]
MSDRTARSASNDNNLITKTSVKENGDHGMQQHTPQKCTETHTGPLRASQSLEIIRELHVESSKNPSDKTPAFINERPNLIPYPNGVELSEPYEPQNGEMPLDFRPLQLQSWFLIASSIFFGTCLSAIGLLLFLSSRREGPFRPKNGYYYAAGRYVPTIIGTVTTILWRSIFSSLVRMAPFFSMARHRGSLLESGGHPYKTILARYFPFVGLRNSGRNGHYMLLMGRLSTRFIIGFLVPMKSAYILPPTKITAFETLAASQDVKVLSDAVDNLSSSPLSLRISPVISYILLVIYATLLIATVAITVRLWGRETGLKWDPVSIADQIQLFHGERQLLYYYMKDIDTLPVNLGERTLFDRFANVSRLRLGYWKRSNGEVWHGIGILKGIGSVLPVGEQDNDSQTVHNKWFLPANRKIFDFKTKARRNSRRFLTGSLHPSKITLQMLMTMGVLVWLLVFQLDGRFARGWNPDFPLFWVIILFTSLPTGFAGVWVVYFFQADALLRILQPFAAMSRPGGADAQDSILLAYTNQLPGEIVIRALVNKHYKLAAVSTMSFVSIFIPIVVAGAFRVAPNYITSSNGTITGIKSYHVTVFERNIFTLIVYLLVAFGVLISLLVNQHARMLPRHPFHLAGLLALCYDSNVLADADVFGITDHVEERQCHFYARVLLKKARYAFGSCNPRESEGMGRVEAGRVGFDYRGFVKCVGYGRGSEIFRDPVVEHGYFRPKSYERKA